METARSRGSAPIASEEPMTCPPGTPAPATAIENTPGQWSRPAEWLISGVRPNSPMASTSVLSRSPRESMSSSSVENDWSNSG